MNDYKIKIKLRQKKRGRPGNITRFYREVSLRDIIELLPYAQLDDMAWFKNMQSYLINLTHNLIGSSSGLSAEMIEHDNERLLELEKLPIAKFFERSPVTRQLLPDLQISGVRRKRAIELSEALLHLAQRNPYLVRHAVLGYCYAVTDRMRIVLTDYQEAVYGRVLILLVNELSLSWLGWRLVGFEFDGQKQDPATWLSELDLDLETDIQYQKTRNASELDHIVIDVVINQSGRNSREFLEVMMLAAIVELWKCVLPIAG